MAQKHKKVKISIISLRLWEIKELSESNIVLQDCYNGHLAHFQYTSLSRLSKKFFHSTLLSIQSLILGPTWNGEDASFDCAQADWLRITGIEDPATCPGHKQSLWDKPLPLTTFNLKLSDEAVRVAVGLRLGSAICEPHTCVCGAPVSARGSHGLSCSLGFGRQARHSNINDIILRSLNRAGTPAIREPSGLTRLDGKRPDGQTLVPWNDGRSLIWDATVVDTVAA